VEATIAGTKLPQLGKKKHKNAVQRPISSRIHHTNVSELCGAWLDVLVQQYSGTFLRAVVFGVEMEIR